MTLFVSDLPAWVFRLSALVFGALWGSFFNVAIYRWPRDMSVVIPPSHCPHCGVDIPAHRNVPILGWLLLRGKTACCGEPLAARYVLVEATSALLCVAVVELYVIGAPADATVAETGVTALLFFFFTGGLLIATFVDLEWMEIPDEVTLGGAALGLATLSLRHPSPDATELALGAGGAFLLVQVLLVWSWERLTGRRGMGEGDSKFLMFIGAFLGWKGALFALVAGSFQGMLFALVSALAGGSKTRATDGPIASKPDPSEVDAGEDAPLCDDGSPDGEQTGWVAPPPLEVCDGTQAALADQGKRLDVHDDRGRLIWEYTALEQPGTGLRRAIPFGPFLALAALEFLFFGERLMEFYFNLFM